MTPAASLAAEAGMTVFKIAFDRWINGNGSVDLPQIIRELLLGLKAVEP